MFMARTGRPPLPDTDRKGCTFRVRMTDEDKAVIDAAAVAADKAASEWAREILLKAATRDAKMKQR